MQKSKNKDKKIIIKLRDQGMKLETLVEEIIKKSVRLAIENPNEFSWKISNILAEEYKIDKLASSRICSPVFWYLVDNGYIKQVFPYWELEREKITNEEIKRIAKKIVEKYKEYFEANIEKFSLK
jgi:hypothetical protein